MRGLSIQRTFRPALAAWLSTLAVLGVVAAGRAQAETAHIVGIGAASCTRFNEEVARNPPVERDYVAWAQGFMSGVLIRAPAGVDENLDLLPPTYPLQRQADFLRSFCRNNPDRDYSDGVLDLYRLLRNPSS